MEEIYASINTEISCFLSPTLIIAVNNFLPIFHIGKNVEKKENHIPKDKDQTSQGLHDLQVLGTMMQGIFSVIFRLCMNTKVFKYKGLKSFLEHWFHTLCSCKNFG